MAVTTRAICVFKVASRSGYEKEPMPKRYDQACPVAKALEVLGDRWTLLIVRDLLRGARRFQDFQTSLTGIAPTILSDRLKLMEEHGLIVRRFYSDHPPRAEYLLRSEEHTSELQS